MTLNTAQLTLLNRRFFDENVDRNALQDSLKQNIFKKFEKIEIFESQNVDRELKDMIFLKNELKERKVNQYITLTNERIERQLETISRLKAHWKALPDTCKEKNRETFGTLLQNVFEKFDAWRDENETNRNLWERLLLDGRAKDFDFDKYKVSLRNKYQQYIMALDGFLRFVAAHYNDIPFDRLRATVFEVPKEEQRALMEPVPQPRQEYDVPDFKQLVQILQDESKELRDERFDNARHIPKPVARKRINIEQYEDDLKFDAGNGDVDHKFYVGGIIPRNL